MKIDKPGRDTLESYFVKNAVPTQSNFEDLIGAGLNQRDDGIAKLPGEPLSLQADGGDGSQKKLLNLYRSFADAQPAWTLALNPRSDPRNAQTARAGLGVTTADGVPRLFIDQTSGNLGVGTLGSEARLDVAGTLKITASHNSVRDADSGLSYGGNQVIKGNAPQIDFIDTEHRDWAIHVNENRLYFIREPWEYQDLVLDGNGNVGMGTSQPRAKLEVRGGAIMPSFGAAAGSGIQFPCDAAGNNSDSAWLRYYARSGEACTLELGLNGKSDDHLALMPSGHVGIGTNEPRARLEVRGGAIMPAAGSSPTTGIQFPSDPGGGSGDTAWIRFFARSGEACNLEIGVANDGEDHISLMPSGNVGVGTRTPMGKLDVQGSIMAGNSDLYFTRTDHIHTGFGNTAGYAAIENAKDYNALMILGRATGVPNEGRRVEVWDYLRVNGRFIQNSDARAKQDVRALDLGLAEVLRLKPVAYRWKALRTDDDQLGLIAQDVREVIPQAVHVDDPKQPDSRLGISYDSLVAVLINAVQELAGRLQALEAADGRAGAASGVPGGAPAR
ncbi:tail fiber domain-containing protein [Ideonella sp. DXS22W]|uniref:Tail fiber domain-containing protein n=1 Tax=Pseudaquabacterium inlustre TaxID=2984192 RepID=A0ABU9CA22_9BURK